MWPTFRVWHVRHQFTTWMEDSFELFFWSCVQINILFKHGGRQRSFRLLEVLPFEVISTNPS